MQKTKQETSQRSSRSNKFVKDLGIYAIGQLGSKLIMFLLVPLYTHFIDPSDYGYYDLSISVIFVLAPIFMFQLTDGSFRYLIETEEHERRSKIISFISYRLAVNTVITILLAVGISFFAHIYLLGLITAYLIIQSVYDVALQVVRGLGKTKFFVQTGILCSFLIAIFSIVTVVWLRLGIEGIFIANIAAKVIAMVYIEIRSHVFSEFISKANIDKKLGMEIIRYSLPILAGTVAWWILSSANKFIIEDHLGLADTGQYAVAMKFASIIQVVATILYQAWQENAIRQFNSPDRDKFFSTVLNSYYYFMCGLVILFSFFVRLNYGWLVGAKFHISSQYVFLLTLSAMIYSFATFFDLGYVCAKKTLYMLPSVIGAIIVNITLSLLTIGPWGIYGIIFSSLASYIFMLLYRIIDTNIHYFRLIIDYRCVVYTLLTIGAAAIYSFRTGIITDIAVLTVTATLFIIFMPRFMKTMFREKFLSKLKH